MEYPNYARSIMSVSSSILGYFGVAPTHDTLPECDAYLARAPRNVLLILADGLGIQMLRDHLSPRGLLRTHVAAQLSSVFPPTTAAALTSVECARTPAEHAWLGWSEYFPELGQNVDVFPNTLSDADSPVQAADYHVAHRYQPISRITDRIQASGTASADYLSAFADPPARSLGDVLLRAEAIFRQPGRHFVFGYSNEPDHTCHARGCRSPQTAAQVRNVEVMLETYLKIKQPDTQVFLIADHGLVDIRMLYVTDHPDLADTLTRRPCVEPRAAAFKVKPGREADFERAFMRAFGGENFILYARRDVPVTRLFGPGALNPRVDAILGDYLAVADGDACISWAPKPGGHPFLATHAGITAPEMRVPFIAL